MPLGLLGRKAGMTQVFDARGRAVPVTVIEAGPCPVVQRKTAGREGYDAVQVGFRPVRKPARMAKPLQGHFAKAKVAPTRHLREFRVPADSALQPGAALTVEMFAVGEPVDVRGVTKGKGFQGGVRRWGYRGGPKTHGSMFHRAPGSIGASSFPSRVFRGHHMPGRMGGVRQTTKHLEVVRVLPEQGLLLVRGAVPGPTGGLVTVRKAG